MGTLEQSILSEIKEDAGHVKMSKLFREMAPRIDEGHERGCAGGGEGTRGKEG